ncbi:Uncharacterised protein [Leclercia adecarboxylata]|uniref:Uncharacterized protein n=1 Tax=Leclercia adecarboxylata TaxID=83655 RepID=A0A4U9HQQ0_9ENTR|nr:Uncharacterised protein [Leclercia adecarboxylata]
MLGWRADLNRNLIAKSSQSLGKKRRQLSIQILCLRESAPEEQWLRSNHL